MNAANCRIDCFLPPSSIHNNHRTVSQQPCCISRKQRSTVVPFRTRITHRRKPARHTRATSEQAPESATTKASRLASFPTLLRKLAATTDAAEAIDLLIEELHTAEITTLTELDCTSIMAAALERDNTPLALSIFKAMTASATNSFASSLSSLDSASSSSSSSLSQSSALSDSNGNNKEIRSSSNTKSVTTGDHQSIDGLRWPTATIYTTAALVVGLCRALKTKEAMSIILSVRSKGLPISDDIHFGYVVEAPLEASGKPLTVVQPQEGVKAVADSYTRYEYELFSGTLISIASESLVSEENWVVSIARQTGMFRSPATGAVHMAVVETPSGQQRTFRFGTLTPDLPAKMGDRVTVVCSPQTPFFSSRRVLNAAPPRTSPGEPLSLSNHTTRVTSVLVKPPPPGSRNIPSWLLPAMVTFAASEVGTSFVDPVLPYLLAGGAAATAATAYAASTIVVPKLKQLPEKSVSIQASRQKLLGQHVSLEKRMGQLIDETEDDVRVLARLWQLQAKMSAVAAGGEYAARSERVEEARVAIERRLAKRIELIDAYARVLNMIEIEVEMETEVPIAEVEGIESQIARLDEVEELQAEWTLQAEAQDEVERLLRAGGFGGGGFV